MSVIMLAMLPTASMLGDVVHFRSRCDALSVDDRDHKDRATTSQQGGAPAQPSPLAQPSHVQYASGSIANQMRFSATACSLGASRHSLGDQNLHEYEHQVVNAVRSQLTSTCVWLSDERVMILETCKHMFQETQIISSTVIVARRFECGGGIAGNDGVNGITMYAA